MEDAKKKEGTANVIRSMPLERLVAHPDNPNEMSRVNFAKLVRNIEQTGRYEPLIVRPSSDKADYFQIINGHHRCHALMKLGYRSVDCVVWEIDDEQTDILLATLNRLRGTDRLEKKLRLLRRLNSGLGSGKLGKLVPQTQKQIERLANLRVPSSPAKPGAKAFANPMVFFLDDEQQKTVENALSLAEQDVTVPVAKAATRASRKAAALTCIARQFVESSPVSSGSAQ